MTIFRSRVFAHAGWGLLIDLGKVNEIEERRNVFYARKGKRCHCKRIKWIMPRRIVVLWSRNLHPGGIDRMTTACSVTAICRAALEIVKMKLFFND